MDNKAKSLEWVVGEVRDGEKSNLQVLRSRVQEWNEGCWVIQDQNPILVDGRECVNMEGRQLVTSITLNGIKLHRAFAAVANNVPVQLMLSEAKILGWEDQCLKACLLEINRTIQKRAEEEERKAKVKARTETQGS